MFGSTTLTSTKNRIRPITCKISTEQRDSGTGMTKPQTSAGVSQKEVTKYEKQKNQTENKLKAKPITTNWNKCQTVLKKTKSKDSEKDINGLSTSVFKFLKNGGYSIGKSIGEGSYCKVRTAFKTDDTGYIKRIACKIIDKRKASNEFVVKFLPRELGIIKRISHPNIVSVFDVYEMDNTVFIFMELCERGDLLDYIRDHGPLPESRVKLFFRQIVSAVEYLHSLDVAHRDLKCENVLLSRNDLVKITDFGFARWCKNSSGRRILSETFCGSAAYAAPEILQGHNYNPKMYDVWSLGCVLYIMLTATMPFDDSNITQMLEIQLNHSLKFPSQSNLVISLAAKKMVWHLLEADITKRATLTQVSRSNWFKSTN